MLGTAADLSRCDDSFLSQIAFVDSEFAVPSCSWQAYDRIWSVDPLRFEMSICCYTVGHLTYLGERHFPLSCGFTEGERGIVGPGMANRKDVEKGHNLL